MRRWTLVAVAALALGLASAPPPRPLTGDLKEMQGRWEVCSWYMVRWEPGYSFHGGQPSLGPMLYLQEDWWRINSVRVSGARMSFARDGNVTAEWLLRVAPKKSGAVDLVKQGVAVPAIYKFDGDALTICYKDDGKVRPVGFTETDQWKLVLKRKKP